MLYFCFGGCPVEEYNMFTTSNSDYLYLLLLLPHTMHKTGGHIRTKAGTATFFFLTASWVPCLERYVTTFFF